MIGTWIQSDAWAPGGSTVTSRNTLDAYPQDTDTPA